MEKEFKRVQASKERVLNETELIRIVNRLAIEMWNSPVKEILLNHLILHSLLR